MKAAVYDRYGPPEVVHLKEVLTPEPKDDEVLVRIHFTTVNSGDWRVRSLDVPAGFGFFIRLALGIFAPRKRILGMEFSGVVEAIGKNVTKFQVGDAVISGAEFGGHAEYRAVQEGGAIALKPANLSFEEAAALCFGGVTALHFVRDGAKVQPGESVLVNGASGATGIASMQIAKHLGAEVTAVCSGANAALVRALGADHVIDYTKEDFTKNGKTYDVIVDTAGTAPWPVSKNSLSQRGRLLIVLSSLWAMIQAPLVSRKGGRSVIGGVATANPENLADIAALAAKGVLKPHIERVYPFEEIVKAHAHVETGRKKGSVAVSIITE
jgi:NADPH:quinone reductase-like Zn-dependent oxidoreductase